MRSLSLKVVCLLGLTMTLANANDIVSMDGPIEYYDLNSKSQGDIDKARLPKLPIHIIKNDDVQGRVKVKLLDGSLIWLDSMDIDMSADSKATITCKSANTGKSVTTQEAVNMGFGNCVDVR